MDEEKRENKDILDDSDDLDVSGEFEDLIESSSSETYELRLFVAGMTPKSKRAVERVRRICDDYLEGRYELEVIDLYQKPELARGERVIAAPTLVKKLPPPLRKIIGDMSNEEKLLVGLDLKKKDEEGN